MCIYCNFLWKESYHLGLYCFLIWGYTGKEMNWIHSCASLTKITLYIPTCPILLQLLLFSLSVKTCFYVGQLLITMFLLVDGWIFFLITFAFLGFFLILRCWKKSWKKNKTKKDTNKKSKKDTQKRWLPPQIDMGRLKQMHLLLLACF